MEKAKFTNEHGVEIVVHFDDLKFQHLDTIERTATYECRGFDVNGGQYSGIAEFTCGELESITDIERIND